MLKTLFITIGVVLGSIFLIAIIGMSLPNPRISTNTFYILSPIDVVWNQVTNHKNQVQWRKSLKEISINKNDPNQWTEIPHNGPSITFKTGESVKHSTYRIEILPISGFQGYTIIEFSEEEGKNTKLTFTEASDTVNTFQRVLAYLFYDPKKSMEIYEKDLKESLKN